MNSRILHNTLQSVYTTRMMSCLSNERKESAIKYEKRRRVLTFYVVVRYRRLRGAHLLPLKLRIVAVADPILDCIPQTN